MWKYTDNKQDSSTRSEERGKSPKSGRKLRSSYCTGRGILYTFEVLVRLIKKKKTLKTNIVWKKTYLEYEIKYLKKALLSGL